MEAGRRMVRGKGWGSYRLAGTVSVREDENIPKMDGDDSGLTMRMYLNKATEQYTSNS